MKILVLNSGSSSIKYQLFSMKNEDVLAKGVVQRIGIDDSFLEHERNGYEIKIETNIPDHARGIELVIEALLDKEHGVLDNMDEINAIGHRVVHGGEKFSQSTIINEQVIKQIEGVSDLAPLHNPHNLSGIKVCSQLIPNKPQVAVFDTAFHQTMPRWAYIYALPYEYYEKYGIRRYGFHGTSHKYVAQRTAACMGRPLEELKIISCHLGNGTSIAAIKNGESIDTSMGLTPLEGLVMGTRCGDIDPAIIPFIMNKENLSMAEMDNIMNKDSGLFGVSGISNDHRDIESEANDGNKRAQIALEIFNYRVKKYIGAYMVAMGGIDAIVFTAGIGENQISPRENILKDLDFLNIHLNKETCNIKGQEVEISTKESSVKVFIIPTNEELMIARDTEEILKSL